MTIGHGRATAVPPVRWLSVASADELAVTSETGELTMAKHYHVGHNMPGYSPDDVYTVDTKEEAQRAVAEDVRRYRESEWDLPRGQRRTAHGSAKRGYVKFHRAGDAYDLGYAYWWDGPCFGEDCAQDDD